MTWMVWVGMSRSISWGCLVSFPVCTKIAVGKKGKATVLQLESNLENAVEEEMANQIFEQTIGKHTYEGKHISLVTHKSLLFTVA